jgi:hypothetical protein
LTHQFHLAAQVSGRRIRGWSAGLSQMNNGFGRRGAGSTITVPNVCRGGFETRPCISAIH